MDNFRFHMYTDIVFGHGVEEQAGKKVKEYGGTKVMLVYGGGSIKRSGLYDKVVAGLKNENIPFIELPGVQPNPLLSYAYKGLETAKKEGVDFLLAVGGGSSIDTAKGIALGLVYDGDIWDFYSGKAKPEKMAPVGTIPTIAAAGSETSRSSVLVNDERVKKGFLYDPCRPVFALMNPEWTFTLPAFQTAAGAADIFAHVVERYFYPSDTYIGDKIAEGLMRAIVKYTPVALADPSNYKARAEIMLAGSFGHNDLAGVGRSGPIMERACHGLEAQISGLFDTTHGAGLSVIMPAWMEYTYNRTNMAQHISFATEVFDVEMDNRHPEQVVLEGIRRFRDWLKRIGMPVSFTEMGLTKENVKEIFLKSAPAEGETIGTLVKLTAADMENIYNCAL